MRRGVAEGTGGGRVRRARLSMMATLRLFAAARQAAGTAREVLPGTTVAQVLAEAEARFGSSFSEVLARSRVWVNGEPADPATPLTEGDEVAVLPPVSGGA